MKTATVLRFSPVILIATATLAQAHPGHGPVDLVAGFAHPFTGYDHLLAMVAVGLWAAQLAGTARWALPACFIGAMALGAIIGIAGVVPPGMEWPILTSVFVLGLLIACSARLPLAAGLVIVALAGACHGIAHGAEMPAHADSIRFLAGMVSATALLHAAGIAVGIFAGRRSPAMVRWAGAGIVAGGLLLCMA